MLGDKAALDAADRWIDDWLLSIQQRTAHTQAMLAQIGQVRGFAHSVDSCVKVTVNPEGALVALILDEDVTRQSGKRIAQQILHAVDEAHARAAQEAAGVARSVGGPDSSTAQALAQSLVSSGGPAGRVFRSQDGFIEAALRPSGRLTHLDLDDRIVHNAPEDTARILLQMTAAARQAGMRPIDEDL